MPAARNRTVFIWGLTLLSGGYFANLALMLSGIHGYLRELTRFITIVGLVLTLVGLIQIIVKKVKKK